MVRHATTCERAARPSDATDVLAERLVSVLPRGGGAHGPPRVCEIASESPAGGVLALAGRILCRAPNITYALVQHPPEGVSHDFRVL